MAFSAASRILCSTPSSPSVVLDQSHHSKNDDCDVRMARESVSCQRDCGDVATARLTSCTHPRLRLLQHLSWTPMLLCSVFHQLQLLRPNCAPPCLPTRELSQRFTFQHQRPAVRYDLDHIISSLSASGKCMSPGQAQQRRTQKATVRINTTSAIQAREGRCETNWLQPDLRCSRMRVASDAIDQSRPITSFPMITSTAMFVLAAGAALRRTVPTATVLGRALVRVTVLAMVSIAV